MRNILLNLAVSLDGFIKSPNCEFDWCFTDQEGKDIWLFGGSNLIASMLNAGLVDELHLSVHPILLGGGKPLFQGVEGRIKTELLDTKAYSTGLVQLFYRVQSNT